MNKRAPSHHSGVIEMSFNCSDCLMRDIEGAMTELALGRDDRVLIVDPGDEAQAAARRLRSAQDDIAVYPEDGAVSRHSML